MTEREDLNLIFARLDESKLSRAEEVKKKREEERVAQERVLTSKHNSRSVYERYAAFLTEDSMDTANMRDEVHPRQVSLYDMSRPEEENATDVVELFDVDDTVEDRPLMDENVEQLENAPAFAPEEVEAELYFEEQNTENKSAVEESFEVPLVELFDTDTNETVQEESVQEISIVEIVSDEKSNTSDTSTSLQLDDEISQESAKVLQKATAPADEPTGKKDKQIIEVLATDEGQGVRGYLDFCYNADLKKGAYAVVVDRAGQVSIFADGGESNDMFEYGYKGATVLLEYAAKNCIQALVIHTADSLAEELQNNVGVLRFGCSDVQRKFVIAAQAFLRNACAEFSNSSGNAKREELAGELAEKLMLCV